MEREHQSTPAAEIVPQTSYNPLTIHYARRTIKMVTISEAELDSVAAGGSSVNLGLLGISCGTFLTCVTTLATVDLTVPRIYASFVALAWVSGLASLFFAIQAGRELYAVRQRVKSIKSGSSTE
jgi:hypothetical protein